MDRCIITEKVVVEMKREIKKSDLDAAYSRMQAYCQTRESRCSDCYLQILCTAGDITNLAEKCKGNIIEERKELFKRLSISSDILFEMTHRFATNKLSKINKELSSSKGKGGEPSSLNAQPKNSESYVLAYNRMCNQCTHAMGKCKTCYMHLVCKEINTGGRLTKGSKTVRFSRRQSLNKLYTATSKYYEFLNDLSNMSLTKHREKWEALVFTKASKRQLEVSNNLDCESSTKVAIPEPLSMSKGDTIAAEVLALKHCTSCRKEVDLQKRMCYICYIKLLFNTIDLDTAADYLLHSGCPHYEVHELFCLFGNTWMNPHSHTSTKHQKALEESIGKWDDSYDVHHLFGHEKGDDLNNLILAKKKHHKLYHKLWEGRHASLLEQLSFFNDMEEMDRQRCEANLSFMRTVSGER